MDTLEKDLQRHSKAELIALIKHLLQLQPDLAWVLQTWPPDERHRTYGTLLRRLGKH